VLAVQDVLGAHELAVELVERKTGGQHGVLDVEEAVVPGRERRDSVSQVSVPGYGVLIVMWTISGTASAHSRTAAKRRSSQSGSAMMFDRHHEPELARDLQGAQVLVDVHPLAVEAEPFLVDRLDAEDM